jgi:hypothetical protein
MILSNNVLYSRVLTPYGRVVKEPTALGALLIGIGFVVVFGLIVFLWASL